MRPAVARLSIARARKDVTAEGYANGVRILPGR